MAAIDSAAGRLEWIMATTCLPEADEELPEPWALWLDLWAQAVRHPEVARVRAEFDARWRATIAGVVVEGEASGEFVPGRRHGVRHHAVGTARRVRRADRTRGPVVSPETAFACAMTFAADRLGFAWSGVGAPDGPSAKGKGKAKGADAPLTCSGPEGWCTGAALPTLSDHSTGIRPGQPG